MLGRLRLGRALGRHRRRRCGPSAVKALVSVSGYLIGNQAAGKSAAVAPGRAAVVVPVLLRHRARPRRLRRRTRQEFAKLIWKRPRRSGASMTRPSTAAPAALDNPDHVGIVVSQLPVAAGPGPGRASLRRAGAAAGQPRRPSASRPSPWKATPTARRTPPLTTTPSVHGPLRPPPDQRRHRPQPAPGSPAGVSPRR